MASSPSRLSAIQRDLLEAFFQRDQSFVLTGGGALAGYYLYHRESQDIDLFGRPSADIDLAEVHLRDAAREVGAELRADIRTPDFRRFAAERDGETTLVDLVIDRAPEVDPAKSRFGAVRVDSMREIAANKICTLLSRCEIRDLVDLRSLLSAGIELGAALADAEKKDGGVNPATLAWLLDELSIGEEAQLPGDASAGELTVFKEELVARLRALAFPSD